MKQIIRITVGLTVSCLLAGVVMSGVFIVTAKAKKHNEYLNVQQTMYGLLGYNKANPAPADLRLRFLHRYLVEDGSARCLGYMIPIQAGSERGYELLRIDLEGRLVDRHRLDISPEKAMEEEERELVLKRVLGRSQTITYADTAIIATLGGDRLAYLLPGEFPGFKTFIRVMVALDSHFTIVGLEIMEHEEDPGLGAEIEQEYFKNQFKDKDVATLKTLKVIKEPLPIEYRDYMEREKYKKGHFSGEDISRIRRMYQERDIYALTGATISSTAVTEGVKGMVKRFAYRIVVLDKVISSQGIPVAF